MTKIKPSDLDAEAQRLIEAGQMPSLETLLTVIAEVREKYAIRYCRHVIRSAGRDEPNYRFEVDSDPGEDHTDEHRQ